MDPEKEHMKQQYVLQFLASQMLNTANNML
jgi:hypothetical protein